MQPDGVTIFWLGGYPVQLKILLLFEFWAWRVNQPGFLDNFLALYRCTGAELQIKFAFQVAKIGTQTPKSSI